MPPGKQAPGAEINYAIQRKIKRYREIMVSILILLFFSINALGK
ncbi:Uncharacterised protein [Mycobacteroides abscessus subsp. abscessus]|nr:Uncharacterised protein [Mycobacteroides abscessus subsp. abscessus]